MFLTSLPFKMFPKILVPSFVKVKAYFPNSCLKCVCFNKLVYYHDALYCHKLSYLGNMTQEDNIPEGRATVQLIN